MDPMFASYSIPFFTPLNLLLTLKNKILQSDEFKSSNVVNKNRIVEIPSVYLTRQGNTAVQGIKYIESQLAK